MNILLCCSMGITTGILAASMRKVCDPSDSITACPIQQLEENLQPGCIVLLAPFYRHRFAEVDALCLAGSSTCKVIDDADYMAVDGAAILKKLGSGTIKIL